MIKFGNYSYADSIIHKIDIRVKILFISGLAVITFLVDNFVGLFIAASIFIIAFFLSKTSILKAVRFLKPLMYILVFTIMFHSIRPYGFESGLYYDFGFIKLSSTGLREGLFFSARIAILVIGTTLVSFTTPATLIIEGMEYFLSLGGIFKSFAQKSTMVVGISIIYIPMLFEEAGKLMQAQTARGANFTSKNILDRTKNYLSIIIPLFISSLRKADNLSEAMEARCYDSFKDRTKLNKLNMMTHDWISLVVTAVMFFVIISINKFL